MNSIFLLWLLSFCLLQASAQMNFRKGFLVTNSGDTLHGFFFLIERNGAIGECMVTSSPNGGTQSTIRMDTCKTIQLESPDHSDEVWRVTRSMTHVDKFDFTIKNQDSVRTEAIYLKRLYSGKKLSLYHCRDVGDHFFIFDGQQMIELMVKYRTYTVWERMKYIDRKFPAYETIPFYVDQLKQYYDFSSKRKMQNLLNHTNYEEKELVKLFRLMDPL